MVLLDFLRQALILNSLYCGSQPRTPNLPASLSLVLASQAKAATPECLRDQPLQGCGLDIWLQLSKEVRIPSHSGSPRVNMLCLHV